MTIKGALLAASAFGFIAAIAPQAMADGAKDGAQQVICDGINSCKGSGTCAGPGHSCAGQNACKGQGHSKVSKEECLAKGGKVVEQKNDKMK
jgi:uncharacterized membrane protein